MITNLFATLSGIFAIAGYAPYIRETLHGRVKPHLYSWLVWTVLQLIAVAAILQGGGGVAASAGLAVGAVLCVLTMGLAVVHGTRDIRRSDGWFLAGALTATALYLALTDPVWAVVVVCVIDLLGFVPTMRKAWRAPESEHVALYACSALANACALVALETVTFTTAAYAASLAVTNVVCVALILSSSRQTRAPDRLA